MTMTALSYWKHVKTGGVYAVVGVAVEEATLRPVVLYRKAGDAYATIFTRPAAEFMDGRFIHSEGPPFKGGVVAVNMELPGVVPGPEAVVRRRPPGSDKDLGPYQPEADGEMLDRLGEAKAVRRRNTMAADPDCHGEPSE